MYSHAYTQVKLRPNAIVRINPQTRPLRSFSRSEWCAQVTVVPEVSRISVLSSGRCQGSKVWTLLGRPGAAGVSDARHFAQLVGEQGGVEIGPEPGDEEHHFRGDEQDHAVAVGYLHDAAVVSLVGRLAGDVAPPAE